MREWKRRRKSIFKHCGVPVNKVKVAMILKSNKRRQMLRELKMVMFMKVC